jgi:hypothetical protein
VGAVKKQVWDNRRNRQKVVPLIYTNKYDSIWFCNNLFLVKSGRKFGFVDKKGKEVMPFIYDDAFHLNYNLASVKQNGKYGFIDETGNAVIPFKYDEATYFCYDLARVKLNGKYGFINRENEVIIPFMYENAKDFTSN